MVKKFFLNENGRFPGQTHAKPPPILVEDMPEWELEEVLDHRELYGKTQFLVKWKGYPNSDNHWERLECLANAMDLVQAWWTDNIPGEPFPAVTEFINMSYTPTTPRPNSTTKGKVIVTFASPISKAIITTLDLRNVELLQVRFRFSLLDGNRCFVSGV